MFQIKVVFLLWLPYILCMRRPGKRITWRMLCMSNKKKKEMELQERSSKSLLANVLDIDDDFRNVGNNSGGGVSGGGGYIRPTTIEETGLIQNNGNNRELQIILQELRYITCRMKKADEEAEVISDWKFAAMVVDRFCLLIFTAFTIIATVCVLFSAPHIIVQ